MEYRQLPPWVERNKVLRKFWLDHLDQSVIDTDITEMRFFPKTKPEKSLLDEKLADPEFLKKLDRYNYIEFTKKGLVYHLEDFDVNSKDENAIAKTKLLGEILNQISDENDMQINELREQDQKKIQGDQDQELYSDDEKIKEIFSDKKGLEDQIMKYPSIFKKEKQEVFTPGKIHLEELTRMYYLNNRNPYKYNVAFFADYFDLNPSEIRELTESLSVPYYNLKTQKINKITRFVDIQKE